MGIPREIARLNGNEDFLHINSNKLGPGDYNPNTSFVQKTSPAAGFGREKGNYQSTQNQWEDKMEKYVGVRPGEKKVHIKEGKFSPMHSFEVQMRNK